MQIDRDTAEAGSTRSNSPLLFLQVIDCRWSIAHPCMHMLASLPTRFAMVSSTDHVRCAWTTDHIQSVLVILFSVTKTVMSIFLNVFYWSCRSIAFRWEFSVYSHWINLNQSTETTYLVILTWAQRALMYTDVGNWTIHGLKARVSYDMTVLNAT